MSRHVMGENPVKIIRWSGPVIFPSGEVGYMICRSGSLEECREYAEQVAKEFGVTVEAVICTIKKLTFRRRQPVHNKRE